MELAAGRERVVAVAIAGLDAAIKAFDDELDTLLAGELAAVGFGLRFGREGGDGRYATLLADFPAGAVGGYFDCGHSSLG